MSPSPLHSVVTAIPSTYKHNENIPLRCIAARLSPTVQKEIKKEDRRASIMQPPTSPPTIENNIGAKVGFPTPTSPPTITDFSAGAASNDENASPAIPRPSPLTVDNNNGTTHHHTHHHMIPITVLSPRRALHHAAMQPVFHMYKKPLFALFESYASYDRALAPVHCYGKLGEKNFLTLMTDKNILPSLFSRVELVEVFRAGRKGTFMLDGEESSQHNGDATGGGGKAAGGKAHDKYCGFGDFTVMLSALAIKIFSSEKWNSRFPKPVEKARLLLFWMDQQSRLFVGNGAALMDRVVENQIADAEATASMVFDTYGCDLLADKFPALWKGVEGECRHVYTHYCQLADRLNVGPSANMNRFQFAKIMEEAGVTGEAFKVARVNLVFLKKLVGKEKRLRYEHFYDAIAAVGVDKFGKASNQPDHRVVNATSAYQVTGAGLYVMLLDYLLPLAGKVAAVAYSQKTRNHEERRATNVREGEWMDRWRNIEVLRDIMKSDTNVRDYFGVPEDLEEIDSSSSSSSSEEELSQEEPSQEEPSQEEPSQEEQPSLFANPDTPLPPPPPAYPVSSLPPDDSSQSSIASIMSAQQADLLRTVGELAHKVNEIHQTLMTTNMTNASVSQLTEAATVAGNEVSAIAAVATSRNTSPSKSPHCYVEDLEPSDDEPENIESSPARRNNSLVFTMATTPLRSFSRGSMLSRQGTAIGIPNNYIVMAGGKEEDSFVSSQVSKQELSDMLSDMDSHVKDFERRKSSVGVEKEADFIVEGKAPPMIPAVMPEVVIPSNLTLAGLNAQLNNMQSHITNVEAKQRRRGSLFAEETEAERLEAEMEESITAAQKMEREEEASVSSDEIVTGGAVSNVAGIVSGNAKASDAPEVVDYKAALADAMSGFSDRFSAIETQMGNLINMQQQQQAVPQNANAPISPPSPTRKIVHPEPVRPQPLVGGSGQRRSITFGKPAGLTINVPPNSPSDSSVDSPLILIRPQSKLNDDVGLSLYSSPMRSPPGTAVASSRMAPSMDMDVFGTPREKESSYMQSPQRGALKLTPRFSKSGSDMLFGNLSAIEGGGDGQGSAGRGRPSPRKHSASGDSVGAASVSSNRSSNKSSSKMGGDKRSPFRTRDRMDDYFRSLPNESSRRMSFSKEMVEVRKKRGSVKVDVTVEKKGGERGGNWSGGGHFPVYELSKEARDMIKEKEDPQTPPKSYAGLHGRGRKGEEGGTPFFMKSSYAN